MVCGLAKSAEEAVRLVEDERPDLVVIDLIMPYIDGSRLLAMLSIYPRLAKVVMSSREAASDALHLHLKELGASGFFDKKQIAAAPERFRADLKAVLAGKETKPLGLAPATNARVIQAADRFPTPQDESRRLEELRRLDAANLRPDPCLDIVVRHLAGKLSFPIVAATLIDHDTVWAKAAVGIDRQAMSRGSSICAHTICQEGAFVVADTLIHPATQALPCVTGELGIRAYAGVPIVTRHGVKLGAVCACDTITRSFSESDLASLTEAAKLIADFLEEISETRRQAA